MILPQMMMYINIIKIQDIVTENEDFIETNNQIKQTEIPKKRKVKSLNKIKINLQNQHLLKQKKKEKTSKANYMNLNDLKNYSKEEKNNILDITFSKKNLSPPLTLNNHNKSENEITLKNKSTNKNKNNNENDEEKTSQNKELINFEGNF